MRSRSMVMLLLAVSITIVACGGQESEAELREQRLQARRDSVAMAETLYDPAIFDTLTWESADARVQRGGLVWRTSCEKCHGTSGQGGGPLAEQFNLTVPPLAPAAGDEAEIRHGIFVGHEGEMPNWGLHNLKYRDIDAVTAYMIAELGAKSQ